MEVNVWMKLIYQGEIEELIGKLETISDSCRVHVTQDGLNVTIGLSEVEIQVLTMNYRHTKFSVGMVPTNTYELILAEPCGENLLMKHLARICKSYSEKEINDIFMDMPLLNEYAQNDTYQLKGFAIIFRDHFLEDNLALLKAFEKSGVKKEDILALDKGDETLHRTEITNTFLNEGFHTFVLDNGCCDDRKKMQEAYRKIEKFCKERPDKKIIILDDGAILTKVLSKQKVENIVGIIELTEMGLRRIAKLNELQYPVLNVAKTHLKISITYIEIANSIFLKVLNLLGANKIVGRNVLILGYGDLGAQLAQNFKNFHTRVSIFDPDILKLINAAEHGFTTYLSAYEAIQEVQPFLIIGVSGYQSITEEMVKAMQSGTFVTAGATADVSIFDQLEESGVTTYWIEGYGKRFVLDGKFITVLGNGRSVNLYKSESIPNQANDIFKTANYLATIYLANNFDKLKLNVNNELDRIFDRTELYLKYYKHYFELKKGK